LGDVGAPATGEEIRLIEGRIRRASACPAMATKLCELARPAFARGVVGGAKPRGGIDLRRSRQLRPGFVANGGGFLPAGHSGFHLSPEAALRGGPCVQFVPQDEQAGSHHKGGREHDKQFSHRVFSESWTGICERP
jgi:hypothetical protein